MDGRSVTQDERYLRAQAEYGPALARLARAYEADPDRRRDLLQDIHVAIWRSFALFDGDCSERTWVHRVAHNVGASHIAASRRARAFASLDLLAEIPAPGDPERELGERDALARLTTLIRGLSPPDRQVVLLYLEDFSAAEIGEVTGMSPSAVATKIHRLKTLLARRFHGGRDD